MVALSSTETSPAFQVFWEVRRNRQKAKKGKSVLGEFLYICDMRRGNLGNVK